MTLAGSHGWALLGLCLLALAPIAWKQNQPLQNDPCRVPGALLDVGAIPGATPRGQKLERLDATVVQWSEGVIEDDRQPMDFQWVRSFDARGLYENPTLLLKHEIEPEEHVLVERNVDGTILPVHVVRDGAKRPARMAAYLFVYGNDPVETPFLFALQSSARQFFTGTLPLTAILVEAPAQRRVDPEAEEKAVDWIEAAWRHHARSCLAAG